MVVPTQARAVKMKVALAAPARIRIASCDRSQQSLLQRLIGGSVVATSGAKPCPVQHFKRCGISQARVLKTVEIRALCLNMRVQ